MDPSQHTQLPILVAGAGGMLGQRVVELLNGQGDSNFVAASRDLSKLRHFERKGIKTCKADFNDPDSLHKAFKGINRLLLISTDELQTPGLRIIQHHNAIDTAKAAGIGHIVYTSMPNPHSSTAIPFVKDHVATEQALEDSGLNYTILRVSWYSENMMAYLPQIIQAGVWPTAAGMGKIAFVSREDVARVAAAALLNETGSHIYDITGSKAFTIPQIRYIVQKVFDREIKVVDISPDELQKKLHQIKIAAPFIPTIKMTDLNIKSGMFDIVTDAISQLTGSLAKSIEEFFQLHYSQFFSIN